MGNDLQSITERNTEINSENNIVQLGSELKKRVFTISEAHELLPLIYHITEGAQKEVKSLVNNLEAIKQSSSTKAKEYEAQINVIVERWQQKLQRLGASPKGLWLADFDNGSGYYCWKFPETKIAHWHGYNDGFSGRMPIEGN